MGDAPSTNSASESRLSWSLSIIMNSSYSSSKKSKYLRNFLNSDLDGVFRMSREEAWAKYECMYV